MRRSHHLPLRNLCALVVLMLLLPVVSAMAAETGKPAVREVATVIGTNAVRYPQLEGLADEAVQERINNAIVEKAKVAQRMVTLATLKPGGTGLQVSYGTYLNGDVFSAVVSAVGIMENGRAGQEYTAFNYRLSSGEPMGIDQLFADTGGAVNYMEEKLTATYLDELGSYVENAAVAPLPRASFALDADGITFYYPREQFSLVSGYCGAAQFYYSELLPYLDQSPQGLPAALGLLPETLTDAQVKAAVAQTAKAGILPNVPVKLDDPMPGVIAAYRLLREPDQYPGGRYCQMEAPLFRQVLVLTDALTSGFEGSAVSGLLSYRANLYGIRAGETTQTRWREILGEPASTVSFDEQLAASYGLPAGTGDYYNFDAAQLLLYADADGVLYAVRLTRA